MSDIHDLHPSKTKQPGDKRPEDGRPANEDSSAEVLKARLQNLLSEHRDLDDVIARLTETGVANQLQMQRMKKRKLALKDEIARLHALALPDIIA